MNTQIKKMTKFAALTLGMLAAFSSCGKDKKNNTAIGQNQCPVGQTWNGMQCTYSNSTWSANMNTTACPVGQVNTVEHRCVSQAGCDTTQSMAMVGNQCVRVTIVQNGNGFPGNTMPFPQNNPMMNNGMNPGMNNGPGFGVGVQFGMGNGIGMGMNSEFEMNSGMNQDFGSQGIDSGCNAYSQDDSIYYSCAPVRSQVRSSRARHMSRRECRAGCAVGFVDTSYGCLPKKGCGKCLGNLDGACVE